MSVLIVLLFSLIWLLWLGGMLADHLYGRMGRETSATPLPIRQAELVMEIDPSTFNGAVETIGPVQRSVMVAGTIEALDPVSLSLVIHTDVGRLVYLVVSDLEVITRLAHGDRVRLEADEQGRPATIRKVQHGLAA